MANLESIEAYLIEHRDQLSLLDPEDPNLAELKRLITSVSKWNGNRQYLDQLVQQKDPQFRVERQKQIDELVRIGCPDTLAQRYEAYIAPLPHFTAQPYGELANLDRKTFGLSPLLVEPRLFFEQLAFKAGFKVNDDLTSKALRGVSGTYKPILENPLFEQPESPYVAWIEKLLEADYKGDGPEGLYFDRVWTFQGGNIFKKRPANAFDGLNFALQNKQLLMGGQNIMMPLSESRIDLGSGCYYLPFLMFGTIDDQLTTYYSSYESNPW